MEKGLDKLSQGIEPLTFVGSSLEYHLLHWDPGSMEGEKACWLREMTLIWSNAPLSKVLLKAYIQKLYQKEIYDE